MAEQPAPETEPKMSEAQVLLARLKSKNTRPGRSGAEALSNLSFKEHDTTHNDILPMPSHEEGEPDSTTILSDMKIILKSIGNGCGSCVSVTETSDNTKDKAKQRFRGVVEGFGFGDQHEVFTLANRHQRSSGGSSSAQIPIRFGDKLNIRSHFANEKLLAPNYEKAGADVVFERNLATSAEDWELCPELSSNEARAKLASRAYLRAGDHITLRSCKTRDFLVIKQQATGNGTKNRLCTAGEGQSFANVWQVSMSGIPCLPEWNINRPFLNGKFLIDLTDSEGGKASPSSTVGKPSAPSPKVLDALFKNTSTSSRGYDQYASSKPSKNDLKSLPIALQEKLLIDDLLSVFMGMEGVYVHVLQKKDSAQSMKATADKSKQGGFTTSLSHVKFGVDNADMSLTQLVNRMLPCGELVVKVKAFVTNKSRHEYGMVNHALSSALNVLLKEFNVLVAQLEHQMRMERMTLQKLWFFIQPSLHTLVILGSICDACEGRTGGSVLNVLHRINDQGGDSKTNELMAYILGKASAPYMEMLRRWIFEGVLLDPYKEFMIAEEEYTTKENVTEDFISAYWDKRYSLREAQVVNFLSRLTEKVLTTGKYLNVVRECNRDVRCPDADVLSWDGFGSDGSGISASLLNEASFTELIERAFKFASTTLLDVLLHENKLINRLRSMKHYFLMDEGDLYVNFMDLAEQELKQQMITVSKQRVEGLLQMAVLTSAVNRDPYKEDLMCDFASYSMIQHLDKIHAKDGHTAQNSQSGAASSQSSIGGIDGSSSNLKSSMGASLQGIEVFMVDYKVRWPVSLVVSKKSVIKYQLIFRHLFFARHVERCLKSTWQGQQHLKELDVHVAGGRSYCLRHRMLGFMQSIVYYMTYEVMEPRWHEMETKIRSCHTMDEVLTAHAELQDAILKECLLTNQELLKTLTKIMTICLLFAEQMNRFFQANTLAKPVEEAETMSPMSPNMKKSHYYSNGDGTSKEKLEAGEKGGAEGHGSFGLGAGGGSTGRGDSTAIRQKRIEKQSQHIRVELQQSAYVKMIMSYEKNFDQLFRDFMNDLTKNSRYQFNSHLANLVMRLDYNNFFSAKV